MVSSKDESPIFDIKISSVGPGFISGQGAAQELTGMDLAMKLHYIRTVYYFPAAAFEGLTIVKIKETMFYWLNQAYIPCGRLRRADSGRPYIKCNDCGVRLFEAQCIMSLEEWLKSGDDGSSHKALVPNQALGPELPFCPLVLMQLTKFKCGGTSVGLSWAHVLGDAFSAASFINLWAKVINGQSPARPLNKVQHHVAAHNVKSPIKDPLAIKRLGPVGDLWATSNNSKMETFSFSVSESELTLLQSKICGGKDNQQIPPFESVCTVIWQSVAKVRCGSEPKVVTICRRDSKVSTEEVIMNESLVIHVVKTDFSVIESSPMELGLLIMNRASDEQRKIEEAMENDKGLPDFLVYGVNLTFVDLYDTPFYEMDMRGQKPVYVNCAIDNIGDEGVVLVLPTSKEAGKDHFVGMTMSITLPENQMSELKSILKKEWSIA